MQERTETRPPEPIPGGSFSWKYGAEALFFLGVAIALIKWIGRTTRELRGPPRDQLERERHFHETIQDIAARHRSERQSTSEKKPSK